ncbi:MAG: hypothetical protein Q9160_005675 [Pyrenula sp. 1 TL-2023]
MAAQVNNPVVPPADLESFATYLRGCKRIMALLGAGISASSGLPTFRGAGGYWRAYGATMLATPGAFNEDPGLVWQFYNYRRHMALNAKPNRAHLALAELARRNPAFITLSQNVDGLSPRADHPETQLKSLHGSLFDIRCSRKSCDYLKKNDFTDPVVPALAIPTEDSSKDETNDPIGNKALHEEIKRKAAVVRKDVDIADANVPIPKIKPDDLPHCPKCNELLRPGVVWFGESLPFRTLEAIDKWMDEPDKIDLILVIGTSSKVYPAAGYTDLARAKGARVAVVNMDRQDIGAGGLSEGDWFFHGDAGEVVPEILKSIVGEIEPFQETILPSS